MTLNPWREIVEPHSDARAGMESVCRSFADYYIENRDDFPWETQDSKYPVRLRHACPIHSGRTIPL
jgi:hypothetical protein